MKKLTLIIVASLIPLIGCVQSNNEQPGTSFCEGGCENNNNTPPNNNTIGVPFDRPELKGAFVAGHLGSYWDCPDEAYMGADADSLGDQAACAEGTDCPSFSSCETAQVTISLSNGGTKNAIDVLVDQIELLTVDGESRAILPLVAAIDTATNEAFDGEILIGEEVLLRVEFQGPLDPYELLAPSSTDGGRVAGGGGIIQTTLSAPEHDDVVVESGELYGVPSVDT